MRPFTVLEARSLKARCCQGHRAPGGARGDSAPCPVRFLGGPVVPCLWPRHSGPCVSAPLPVCPLIRTLVIGFRAHPDNPGRSFISSSLKLCLRRHFCCIYRVQRLGCGHILGRPPFNPLLTLLLPNLLKVSCFSSFSYSPPPAPAPSLSRDR